MTGFGRYRSTRPQLSVRPAPTDFNLCAAASASRNGPQAKARLSSSVTAPRCRCCDYACLPTPLHEARQCAVNACSGRQGEAGKVAIRKGCSSTPASSSRWRLRVLRPGGAVLRQDCPPYCEVHHTTRLSDCGLSHPMQGAAVCPNCHRHIHTGRRGAELRVAADAGVYLVDGVPLSGLSSTPTTMPANPPNAVPIGPMPRRRPTMSPPDNPMAADFRVSIRARSSLRVDRHVRDDRLQHGAQQHRIG